MLRTKPTTDEKHRHQVQTLKRTIATLQQGLEEVASGCGDDHYKRWHLGFDAKGEKHNDAGGGYTWAKCYCVKGCAREVLDAALKGN